MTSTALTIGPTAGMDAAPVNFGDLMRLSEALVPTGFLPAHIKTPGQAVAIILTGREMGMEPMRALRSLQMVKGKVIENADSQLARFKDQGGRAQFTRLDETGAVLELRHPNGDAHTETFTMKDAAAAGLTSNDTWRKFPKAMLRSRCITAGLKSVGWSGAIGNYDPDEATHFAPEIVAPAPVVESRAILTPAFPTFPKSQKYAAWTGRPLDEVPTDVLRETLAVARPALADAIGVVLADRAEAAEEVAQEFSGVPPIVSVEQYEGADGLALDDARPTTRRASPQESGQ